MKVLASVDENSYTPATTIKMGDHPVIWSNDHMKARNVYIFMGLITPSSSRTTPSPPSFTTSILWAANQ